MRAFVLLVPPLLVLAGSLSGCKRDAGTSAEPPAEKHDTVPADRDLSDLTRLADGALYDRAMRSGECSTLEGVPCADPLAAETRCELALRAAEKRALRERLLADGKSADRARRAAALRVLTDFPDEVATHFVHDALLDAEPSVSCAAARYGTWFSRADAARLAELEKTCDGKAIIEVTRVAIEKGKPGEIVKGGVTCAEIRAAR